MSNQFHKLSVLVVEDLPPMRKLLSAVLKSLGVGIIYGANNGEEGYQKFCEIQPDIVLTDWLMRPVDGIELTQKIRSDYSSPKRMVPIILITGYTAEHRILEARDVGVTEIMVKPFTASEMAKRLAYVINRPRDFIEAPEFFGPDRRRRSDPSYMGPLRRTVDTDETDSAWEVEF